MINLLNNMDNTSSTIKLLLKKYLMIEQKLKSNNINKNDSLIGSTRAYLDSFSDYNNPILVEMDKAEKLLESFKDSI
ncbi:MULTISPECIES: hypothetical protein [unclassified Streptococcus]|uniref:hypothetical protein n=1 Tax=unclassified Streptococcus TaxID=2608887 RepID=UPI001104D88A|nr:MULTISPECIES: hypothetical protein [unclassified Streptococcus]MCQ9210955.1 hypothetical protein [Streptococcus sp. B01]MCQ9214224.1 hypothetical protein [Streptococcus sp. O1]TFV06517.1 hypothetical protein E4T79_01235 [Streptococcus sp. LYSM12]